MGSRTPVVAGRLAVARVVAGIHLALRPEGPWQLDDRFLDQEDDDGEHRETHEARAPARAG